MVRQRERKKTKTAMTPMTTALVRYKEQELLITRLSTLPIILHQAKPECLKLHLNTRYLAMLLVSYPASA